MKKINQSEVPKEPEIKNCEKHGDYKVKYGDPLWGTVYVFDACTKCIEEENAIKAEDEKKKEDIKNRERKYNRLKAAGLSGRLMSKTFDDFRVENDGQKRAKNLSIALCNDVLEGRQTGSIIMNGGVGTGKTALCSAIISSLVDTKRVKIIKAIDLIRHLKSSWGKKSEQSEKDLIAMYSNLDLLIIDEIGVQFGSETEQMFIFDIIDGRYGEMLPTILISNLGIDSIKKLLGERVIDRLREDGGQLISFDWGSYRK